MATKKQETLPEEEILQEAVLQTDVNPELAEMPQPENDSPDAEPSQTDPEDSLEGPLQKNSRIQDLKKSLTPRLIWKQMMGSRLRSPKKKYLPRPTRIPPEVMTLQETR